MCHVLYPSPPIVISAEPHISWIDGVNVENDTRSNSDERQTKGALLAISTTSVMHSGLLLSSPAIIGFQLTVCGWAVPRVDL